MTSTLTEREKELNKILSLNGMFNKVSHSRKNTNIKALKKEDWNKFAGTSDDVNITTKFIDFFGDGKPIECYNDAILEVNGQVIFTDELMQMKDDMMNTKAFFGLTFNRNEKLLFKISSSYYGPIPNDPADDESHCKIATLDKYNTFLDLCKHADSIKPFIDIAFPDYAKKQSYYNKKLHQLAKDLPDVEFFYVMSDFFSAGWKLNQLNRAKARLLVNSELPNITDEKDALEIIKMINSREKFKGK